MWGGGTYKEKISHKCGTETRMRGIIEDGGEGYS